MKYIKQYQYYRLFESVLLASDDVKEILSGIKSKVGEQISSYISTEADIKTDYNTLGLSDKNDELFFLSDGKTQKMVVSGDDPFGKNKQAMKIGRIARAILAKNGQTVSDKDIEEFVNDYKSGFDMFKNKESEEIKIRLVFGEDIRYWYNVKNYTDDGDLGTSELGKSCMRYARCQEYLDIYVDNPNQCKLLIYLDDDDKLKARALFWKTTGGYYLDRVYTVRNSDKKVMVQWILDNTNHKISFYADAGVIHDNIDDQDFDVKLEHSRDFDYYPYMDTFTYYTPGGLLSRNGGDYCLQETDGGNGYNDDESYIYCEYEGESYHMDDTVYSEYSNVTMRADNAIYSEVHGTYLWEEDSVEIDGEIYHKDEVAYSERLKKDVLIENCYQVYTNEDMTESDWYPQDEEGIEYMEDEYSHFSKMKGYSYFIAELFIQREDGNHILKQYAIRTLNSIDKDKSEMYNDPCTSKLDAEIFDINVDKQTEDWYDIRDYYHTKFMYASYDKWIILTNDAPVDQKLADQKLEELELMHNYFLNNDNSYKVDYGVDVAGGVNAIVKKWNNILDELFSKITDNDIKEELETLIPYSWDIFGATYYDEEERYNVSEEPNKKPISDLVSIFRKLMPSIKELYKKHAYKKQNYSDPKTLHDNEFLFNSLKDKITEITGFDLSDFDDKYYLCLRIRRIVNTILDKYKEADSKEAEYDELGDILTSLYKRKKLK